MNTVGRISEIFYAENAGLPMISVKKVQLIKEKGIEGDRYSNLQGFWQNKNREKIRHVSLIRKCDIEKTIFTAAETRRNIVVDTEIPLLSLIGKNFYIGHVLVKGIEDCAPCKRPSDLSGKKDFAKIFKETGGLRVQVLESGTIEVDQAIAIIEAQ